MSAVEDEPRTPAPGASANGGGAAPEEEEPPQLFQIGETVRRWVIKSRIGGGAFGETYVGVDTAPESRGQEVCIKAEKQDKRPILRTEVLALKRAQDCPQVVRYISSGKHGTVNFLVMEKLGDNLADVRRRCSRGIMDLYSALQYTIACLDCIEQVHSSGLIHRDIKPSNFVLGAPGCPPYTVFIIDFGLAKRFISSSGEIKPPRDNAGFRGTSRYASIASHQQKDLGRVDDLWSLLFMAVEFITGTLPWRRVKEKDAIGQLKQQHVGTQLVRYLPREMTEMVIHLQGLEYESEPDYKLLRQLLQTTITRKQLVPPGSLPPPPQEQAPVPPAAPVVVAPAPGLMSPGGDENGSPAHRSRKPIIVDDVDGGGGSTGNVILHVNTSSPEPRRGLPPMHPSNGDQGAGSPPQPNQPPPAVSSSGGRSNSNPAPVVVLRAGEPRDVPASPINLEMGSMMRSGAATPAAASAAMDDDTNAFPRQAGASSDHHRATEDEAAAAANPPLTGVEVGAEAAREQPKTPAAADASGSPRRADDFDPIVEAPPAHPDFSEARGPEDDDADADGDDAAAGGTASGKDQRARKRRNAKKRKEEDKEGCGCCIVA